MTLKITSVCLLKQISPNLIIYFFENNWTEYCILMNLMENWHRKFVKYYRDIFLQILQSFGNLKLTCNVYYTIIETAIVFSDKKIFATPQIAINDLFILCLLFFCREEAFEMISTA